MSRTKPPADATGVGSLLDSCVASLRRGRANLLRIVPMVTDDHEGNPIPERNPIPEGNLFVVDMSYCDYVDVPMFDMSVFDCVFLYAG